MAQDIPCIHFAAVLSIQLSRDVLADVGLLCDKVSSLEQQLNKGPVFCVDKCLSKCKSKNLWKPMPLIIQVYYNI